MKKTIMPLVCVLLILLNVVPAAATTAGTLPSGLSDDDARLAVERLIRDYQDSIAAVSAAVFRGDEVLFSVERGYANIETGLAASADTVYEWGSISKLLVWVSVMQLWEAGQLDLAADIRSYLPDGFLTKLKYDDPITMLNLMNHNAGWQETVTYVLAANEESIMPLPDALRITEPDQINQPGAVCAYSNWGAGLAGYIVERVSGQPYADYVKERILKPLGMERTAVSPAQTDNLWVRERLQAMEGYTAPDLKAIGAGLFYLSVYPAGAAAGTLGDLVIFAQALMPPEGESSPLFRDRSTLDEMLSPTMTYPDTQLDRNCHGFWVSLHNTRTLGHAGNTVMYSAHMFVDPVSRVGVAVLTNQSQETRLNYGIPQIVFGEVGAMLTETPATAAANVAGLYYQARTTRRGIGKLNSLMSLFPLFKDASGGVSQSLPVLPKIIGTPSGGPMWNIDITMSGSTASYNASFSRSANGTRRISLPFGDFVEADIGIWGAVICAALLLLSVIWAVLVILISPIRWIVRVLSRRDRQTGSFGKWQTLLCLTILLTFTNFILIALKLLPGSATAEALIPHMIAAVVLGAIPVAYMVGLWIHFRNKNAINRAAYWITCCAGLIVTANVVFWELYRL